MMKKSAFLFCVLGIILMISGVLAEEKLEVVVKYDSENATLQIKDVSPSDFQKLKQNDDISVQVNGRVRLFLTESAPLIQAPKTHLLTQGMNLTGHGQSVCIIDTGIANHPDLNANILAQKCYCGNASDYSLSTGCCPNGLKEDSNATDDNGHGTHVAGIVAANGNLVGIANGAGIVAVKVLDSSGAGYDVDVMKAIDWCTSNYALYNISVISMSLGNTELYSSACDLSQATYSSLIAAAVAKNISVVVATGNDGNYTAISSPACISDAIPVGDTYDANVGGIAWSVCTDATTSADKMVCHSNRNSLVKLFAPGALINSTWLNGGYANLGGTSMAAPHVSGAVAIINQYLLAVGRTKTPKQIEQALHDSGKKVVDSQNASQNFSRIDVYSTIISLDTDAPNISIVSPANNSVITRNNQTFNCSISDLSLKNVTFNLWNSTSLVNKTNLDISGSNYDFSITILNLSFDNYVWNCLGYDEHGNFASSGNYSLSIKGVSVVQNYPTNNSYTNVNLTSFNCSAHSESELRNVSFYLWNSSSEVYNETRLISGLDNSSVFNYSFSNEGNYYWNCLSFNNNSNYSWADGNFSINYDITPPIFDSISTSSITTSSAIVSVNSNELVNASINYGNVLANSSYSQNNSFSLSGLSAGTNYNYNITICDRAGNCNSSLGSFTTNSEQAVRSSGGGGGGGGGGAIIIQNLPQTYSPTAEQTSLGYVPELKKDDRVAFMIFDEFAENHTITITSVSNISVSFVVRSNPINVTLGIGQSIKLNLSSSDYYDLFLMLDSLLNGKAKLTIQTIHEPISPQRNVKAFNESESNEFALVERERGWTTWIWVVVAVFLLIAIFYLFDYLERKRIRKELLHDLRRRKRRYLSVNLVI